VTTFTPRFIGTVPVITFDPSGNFQVPLTYAWNIGVEQQLTPRLSSRIAYVGGHGSHIFTSPEINPAVYISGNSTGAGSCAGTTPVPAAGQPCSTTANTNTRRLYQKNPNDVLALPQFQSFSTISLTNMGGNSSFQSLQATLQQHLSHGLSYTVNYTWSKSLDNVPTGAATTSAGAGQGYVIPVYQPNYKRLDVGPSDFDHRNVFTATYVWAFPKLESGWAALRYVVNDWQSSGIVSARTGDHFTVMVGQDISLTGINRDVPLVAGNAYNVAVCPATNPPCKTWLSATAFQQPSPGQFGNEKKNTFTGPNFVTFDTSLARRFNITEHANFQFRAEYFNLLNRTNFNTPASSLASPTFGKISTANDPRIAQLSLKLLF
jgi:hypothetical protein